MVLTPDEKYVIFIVRGSNKGILSGRCSKIFFFPLQAQHGNPATKATFKSLGTLRKLIVAPERCAIAVNALNHSPGWFRLHVLHSDGFLDQEDVDCGS